MYKKERINAALGVRNDNFMPFLYILPEKNYFLLSEISYSKQKYKSIQMLLSDNFFKLIKLKQNY